MKEKIIKLTVKKERVGPILGRHPWIFSGGLKFIPEKIQLGASIHLVNERQEFLAAGYFNSYSQIAVRIWSYDETETVDKDFFIRRIKKACLMRQKYLENEATDSYRLINSENDFIPGLVVDKYADYLVIQCHTRGIEVWKEAIVEALVEVIKPKGIYEKSDAAFRKKEGLEKQVGILFGDAPERIVIKENGLKFLVDIKEGQKTGFFLDQRDKRQALMKYVKGKNVLNCFSYTGGFSVYALAGGAKSVTSVDVSEKAVELSRENMKLNNLDLDKCEFVCDDVKQYLRNIPAGKFDLIVLDPPAFIKDRHKKREGIAGYKGINEAALKVLPEDGLLVSCSCSAHLSTEEFRYVLSEAGGHVKKSLQILESYTHGLDHPSLIPFTEGEYLKCFFVQT